MNIKDTLNLPKTIFKMRANSKINEKIRLKKWEKIGDIYKLIWEKNKKGKIYIVHDGPPFSNGKIHIGTALNKILKDIIVRYQFMNGKRVKIFPGWDCHGLPIEYKVLDQRKKQKKYSKIEIRKKCLSFSKKNVSLMRSQIKRLGIITNWNLEYSTSSNFYETNIIKIFFEMFKKGYIYRSKKPVYWSIPCKTALAEGEIEYKKHKSYSVYVKFNLLKNSRDKLFKKLKIDLNINKKVNLVIWTTTIWTIFSNEAIAINSKIDYVLTDYKKEYLIFAEFFLKKLKENKTKIKILKKIKGETLIGLFAKHPILNNKTIPVIKANFVDIKKGTGCIHIAPAHGLDDYFLGLKNNLNINCYINKKGKFVDKKIISKQFRNQKILDKNNTFLSIENKIIKILKARSLIFLTEYFFHKYPYCWRSKTPIIYRAVNQWFINLTKNNLKNKIVNLIENVEWIPKWSKEKMKKNIKLRPDWCISRQRSWGTPIPIFYDSNKKILFDEKVSKQLIKKFKKKGTDFWFSKNIKNVLNNINIPNKWNKDDLIKEKDTLDVWIDSGCSHLIVLKKNKEDNVFSQSNLLLEGNDQHRGWFQSSLWISAILYKIAPYKKVITHGFVVNKNKCKLSKSSNQSTSENLENYIEKFGVDVIRLWVSSENYTNDISISNEILDQIVIKYRLIRNTIRFQLSNLYDFNPLKFRIRKFGDLSFIDQWALKKTNDLIKIVSNDYKLFLFYKVINKIDLFCSEMSSIYHDILKDRLYTYKKNSKDRRSSQYSIFIIFNILIKLIAPILPFISEEAYESLSLKWKNNSIHFKNWPKSNLDCFYKRKIVQEIDSIISFKRTYLNKKLELLRKQKLISKSIDAMVLIFGNENIKIFKIFKKYEHNLEEIFIVSKVQLILSNNTNILLKVKKASGFRCPRSWKWVPKLVYVEKYGYVSERCKKAIVSNKNN
jgi:isoleucyl-tRNA synthetase